MGFPGRGPFPRGKGSTPRRAKAKAPRGARPEPIPEEERTHAPDTRFKLACGRARIGAGEDLLTRGGEAPTCPACRAALREREKKARLVREALDELGKPSGEW